LAIIPTNKSLESWKISLYRNVDDAGVQRSFVGKEKENGTLSRYDVCMH